MIPHTRTVAIVASRGAIALLGLIAAVATAGCGEGTPGARERPVESGGAAPVVQVAVAANVYPAFEAIAGAFTARTGVEVRTSAGATGQLYAQIRNGAPYHLFLSADEDRPRRLEAEGYGVAGTLRPYALGRLALYAPRLGPLPADALTVLDTPGVVVALANPRTAPYGAAARSVLEATGRGAVRAARGESVAQALQFVEAGAADVGFVALAQVMQRPPSEWSEIAPELYPELTQAAVLLRPGADFAPARDLYAFVFSPEAREILRLQGYGLPPAPVDPNRLP